MFRLILESHDGRALVPSPKRSASPRPTSTPSRDGLKALDLDRPIREADMLVGLPAPAGCSRRRRSVLGRGFPSCTNVGTTPLGLSRPRQRDLLSVPHRTRPASPPAARAPKAVAPPSGVMNSRRLAASFGDIMRGADARPSCSRHFAPRRGGCTTSARIRLRQTRACSLNSDAM